MMKLKDLLVENVSDTIKSIKDFVARNSYFDAENEEKYTISFSTRKNGSVSSETASPIDIKAGQALKNEIQKRAHEHGYKSDIQAFMAAEQLAAKEVELKEMMIYQGRGGMWDDWLAFQQEMKRSREEEEREQRIAKQKRKQAILRAFEWTIATIIALTAVGMISWLALIIIQYQK